MWVDVIRQGSVQGCSSPVKNQPVRIGVGSTQAKIHLLGDHTVCTAGKDMGDRIQVKRSFRGSHCLTACTARSGGQELSADAAQVR